MSANAVISGKFETPNIIIGGVPAKVIKKDIAWKVDWIKMKIGILGLDLNSGNKGCEALAYGFLEILNSIVEKDEKTAEVYLLQKLPTKQYIQSKCSFQKIKKYYKPKYFFNKLNIDIIFLAHTSRKIFFNSKINRMDFVIDFTGGDSFSDIYGLSRFYERTRFKECIMKHDVPLILGSQTIGPFENEDAKKLAVKVIRQSLKVFARDEVSQKYAEKNIRKKNYIDNRCSFCITLFKGSILFKEDKNWV